jgi:iron(III) transport system substrate-binding protein
LLVNTKLLPEKDWPTSLLDLTDAKYRGQVVMAKPWAGTSATQAVCLFEVLGTEQASKYFQGLSDNGLNICPGNAQAAEWISAGLTPKGQRVVVSITDTDDAIKEVKAGHPVRILFPDRKGGTNRRMGTLFIPNTLAILKNCPNPEGARRLVDYLLAPETEKKLAEGGGYQIPLNPEVKAKLPPEIEQARTAKAMDVNFDKAADRWEEATGFLTVELTP